MPELPKEQLEPILNELRAGRKIQAIKLYREFTSVGLAEAKTAIEQLAMDQHIAMPKSGCGTAVLVFLLVLSLAACLLVHR